MSERGGRGGLAYIPVEDVISYYRDTIHVNFQHKKINRNDLSNISNLGHFAFHFIAIIWDFLYLVCEYIFCSKMVWMMSWFYKMTSSSGKWAGLPLLPPTQHESENSIEFRISRNLMILNTYYDFRSGLYTLTVCLKSQYHNYVRIFYVTCTGPKEKGSLL